jgi:hypothetical protein
VLRTDPAAKPVGWPLRGELVSHLDRLRNELRADMPEGRTPHQRARWRRRPLRAGRWQPRSPSRRSRRR